jgi:hypothetical protein
VEHSSLWPFIKRIWKDLEARDLRFKPHFWLSEEFFTPDAVPGVAVPFYLAHPQLVKLERQQMYEAEGSNSRMAMRILRHEAGHAIDHAFYLTRRKERQKIFGKSSLKYPDLYSPKPFSRSFVINLENWYAQSHPVEDFAETFAVWFRPNPTWKRGYKGWPALKKLEYMDRLMKELAGKSAPNKSKAKMEPIRELKKTLGEYYEEKKSRFGLDENEAIYDQDLLRLFSTNEEFKKNISAARFIRKNSRELRTKLARWTGQYSYLIQDFIDQIIYRCEDLNLRVCMDEDETKEELLVFLAIRITNFLNEGGYMLAL